MNDSDKAALADSVGAIATQWLASLATQPTTENFFSSFVHGDDLAHAQYGTVIPTYDSLMAMSRLFFKPMTSMQATFDRRRLTVLDRDVVVLTTLVSGFTQDTSGRKTPMQLAWTAVWHRTSDGWRVAADHESMAPPTPPAAAPGRR